MANLNVQNFGTVGLEPEFSAADVAGDTYTNQGTVYLFIANGGATPVDVTINNITPCNYGYDHDDLATIAAGATTQLGPYAANRFNNADGQVEVSYSSVADITIAVVRV